MRHCFTQRHADTASATQQRCFGMYQKNSGTEMPQVPQSVETGVRFLVDAHWGAHAPPLMIDRCGVLADLF